MQCIEIEFFDEDLERTDKEVKHLKKIAKEFASKQEKLKEAKKFSKFYTNENGQVCYRISDSSNKVKVTYFSPKKDSNPNTLSVDELLHSFKK